MAAPCRRALGPTRHPVERVVMPVDEETERRPVAPDRHVRDGWQIEVPELRTLPEQWSRSSRSSPASQCWSWPTASARTVAAAPSEGVRLPYPGESDRTAHEGRPRNPRTDAPYSCASLGTEKALKWTLFFVVFRSSSTVWTDAPSPPNAMPGWTVSPSSSWPVAPPASAGIRLRPM